MEPSIRSAKRPLPPRRHRNEQIGRGQLHVELQLLLEHRDRPQHGVRLRPHHESHIDRGGAPTNQHRTRTTHEEDVHVGSRMTRQRDHERADPLAVRYLAQWAARRKLVTRRSRAL
jgi:hypothetical protein